jgi:hypothetical protein
MDEQVKYTAATYGDATEPGCGSGRRLTRNGQELWIVPVGDVHAATS